MTAPDRPTEPLLKWIWRAYFRAALIPLLLVEVGLVAVFLLANNLVLQENTDAMRRHADDGLLQIARRETAALDRQLAAVAQSTRIFANATRRALSAPLKAGEIPARESERYAYGERGVYYTRREDGGAAAFYSGLVPIGARERDKVLRTSRLDPLMRDLQANTPLVSQIYLNTSDSLNRIYPYFEVLKQYPPRPGYPRVQFLLRGRRPAQLGQKSGVCRRVHRSGRPGLDGLQHRAGLRRHVLEAVVGLDITVSALVEGVLALQVPWEGYGVLIGKSGAILALPPTGERDLNLAELKEHHYAELVLRDTFKPDDFNFFLRAEFGSLATRLREQASGAGEIVLRGERKRAAWATVPETGWTLLIVVAESAVHTHVVELNRRLQRIGWLLVAGLILFYAVFFAALYLRARRMSKFLAAPLARIDAMAEQIGAGDYSPAAPRFPVR